MGPFALGFAVLVNVAGYGLAAALSTIELRGKDEWALVHLRVEPPASSGEDRETRHTNHNRRQEASCMDGLFNRVARRRRRGQTGFTLIELLVVIAVLAILAAIVLFNVVGVTNRGQAQACATDVKTFQTAADAAIGDAASDGKAQPDASSTAGKLTANASGVNTGNITLLHAGNYIHDAASTTICANALTFTFNNGVDYTGGIAVAGS